MGIYFDEKINDRLRGVSRMANLDIILAAMSSVVREINQEYEARVEALKTGTIHDALSLSGSRAA